jgi:putative endopeptidase
MSFFRETSAVLLVALCATAALAQQPAANAGAEEPAVGFSARWIDDSVEACTDFYQFACGGWLRQYPLPADRARFGRFEQLADRNDRIVRGILERAAAKGEDRTPDEQRIGDLYATCMDEAAIEAQGFAPIEPLLARIDEVGDLSALMAEQARLAPYRYGGIVGFGPQPDPRNSEQYIANVGQGSMGLPDRDLYLNDDERSVMLRKEYRAHAGRMFGLIGQSAEQSAASADRVMEVETEIARAVMDRVAMRDPRRRDNPMTVDELVALGPNVGFRRYFADLGAPAFTRVNVTNPQYVKALDGALASLPMESWRAYLKWRVLSATAPMLSSAFVEESFRFNGTILSGQKELRPRWQRCSILVGGQFGDRSLGEIVGQIFVREHFGPDAERRMAELIAALDRSLERNIRELDWMGPETKERALVKLRAFEKKIGAPETWRDFSEVKVVPGDLVGSRQSVDAAESRYFLRRIGQPVDRSEWAMTPQTVNAYYSPPLNEIVFPAGILQPPFFDVEMDDAVNFGGIGAVIGHEFTHGFDDQGRKYDEKGNLTDWWTAEDDRRFQERAGCMVKQYSAFTVAGGTPLRGELGLGENVADNGGVRIAYYALMDQLSKQPAREKIDGFTPEQRFFLGWAQIWCENASEQFFQRRAQEGPHSPGRYRAIGVVQNSPEFRKAFGCRPPARMAPENMCRVW